MYVGNVVLLILNLPMVGLFVNLLRIPYHVPLSARSCVLRCSACIRSTAAWSTSGSWPVTGLLGYVLRKLDFETAPIVLGLVLAPMLELRLAPVAGDVGRRLCDLLDRPIAAVMLAVGLLLLVLGMRSMFAKGSGWRSALGIEPDAKRERSDR